MRPLVLGSQSPRRKEILEYFTVPFIQANPYFDESTIPFNGDASAFVLAVSKGKALGLSGRYGGFPILTADTVVTLGEKIYGKPKDREEAHSFLCDFSGRWHSVFTGVSLLLNDELYSDVEETGVLFNSLTDSEISAFLQKIDWKDKAGGYAIQKVGGLLVKEIRGCYYNVMGFPLNCVNRLLKRSGIDLWCYLKEG